MKSGKKDSATKQHELYTAEETEMVSKLPLSTRTWKNDPVVVKILQTLLAAGHSRGSIQTKLRRLTKEERRDKVPIVNSCFTADEIETISTLPLDRWTCKDNPSVTRTLLSLLATGRSRASIESKFQRLKNEKESVIR